MKKWRIAGINFDHFHMGDLLRQASEHPNAEIVGISDEQPERMVSASPVWMPTRVRNVAPGGH